MNIKYEIWLHLDDILSKNYNFDLNKTMLT